MSRETAPVRCRKLTFIGEKNDPVVKEESDCHPRSVSTRPGALTGLREGATATNPRNDFFVLYYHVVAAVVQPTRKNGFDKTLLSVV